MPITPEEITEMQAAIAAGNYGENANIKALAGLGFKIRTEQEETTFLTNQEKAVADRKTLEFATGIEKDVLDATGIEKKQGEKYHEYLKRATGEIKTELKTLKEKGGNTSEADKKRIEELEGLVKTKDESHEKVVSELKGTYAKEKVTNVLNSTVDAIRGTLKKETPFLDDIVTARVGKFNAEYKAELKENGALVFVKNSDGKTALNTKTGDPLTAAELLGEFFKDLKDEKPAPKGGAGSGKTGNDGGGAGGNSDDATKYPKAIELTVPDTVKTKGDLAVWMKKESKLAVSSAEYNQTYAKYAKDLPLR